LKVQLGKKNLELENLINKESDLKQMKLDMEKLKHHLNC